MNDLKIGGGRIIGEACHLIDTCNYLTGSLVESVYANSIGNSNRYYVRKHEYNSGYVDGSNAVINYFSNGSKKIAKKELRYILIRKLGF